MINQHFSATRMDNQTAVQELPGSKNQGVADNGPKTKRIDNHRSTNEKEASPR